MKSLMASATQAAQNVAENQIANGDASTAKRWRQGDAVWLDTEKDLLISFFQAFSRQHLRCLELPAAGGGAGRGRNLPAEDHDQPRRYGKGRPAERASGSRDLDEEAMAAVRKGAPYGRLPSAYKEETLTIFAFFQYNLTRRMIYGERP
jgi:periplasmic protein TonB